MPAAAPAGSLNSGVSLMPSQTTRILTEPWCPAAWPAIVLATTSEPAACEYVSVSAAVAVLPADTVTCWPSPVTLTATLWLLPAAVSVTSQAEPAVMWWYVCECVPAGAPAGTLSAGESGDPLQTAWTVTAPWWPAAGPAIVFATLKEPAAGP